MKTIIQGMLSAFAYAKVEGNPSLIISVIADTQKLRDVRDVMLGDRLVLAPGEACILVQDFGGEVGLGASIHVSREAAMLHLVRYAAGRLFGIGHRQSSDIGPKEIPDQIIREFYESHAEGESWEIVYLPDAITAGEQPAK